jgi:Transposase
MVRASVDVHRLQKFTSNTAVWLFIRDPDSLDEIEKQDLEMFCLASPQLSQAYQLVQKFLVMLRKREGQCLDDWLQQVVQSGLAELQSFASGVEKGKDAVRAGLSQTTQQWDGRRACDQAQTDQKARIWPSWISAVTKARPSCLLNLFPIGFLRFLLFLRFYL